jgi:hypothetical protein
MSDATQVEADFQTEKQEVTTNDSEREPTLC